MTSDSNRPDSGLATSGLANSGPAAIEPAAATDSATDTADRTGGASPGNASVRGPEDGDQARRGRVLFRRTAGDAEETDLERRVLAHERILQVLIAHLAEAEPRFVARLSTLFGDPSREDRREGDYTDTQAYADQFIQQVLRLIESRRGPAATGGPTSDHLQAFEASRDAVGNADDEEVTLIEVSHRAGIWEVTRNGRFFGHYVGDQPAFDAAEAAAFAVVAAGGAADVIWNDARSQPDTPGRPEGTTAAQDPRTLQFRPGSSRIVR
jgi:hypothetical protein